MRVLGIDFGQVRIGVSVSDPFGWTAQAVKTISYKENIPYNEILDIVCEYKVEKIIVGYPKNMNGSIGEKALLTDEFISVLDMNCQAMKQNVIILKWDERLSTVSANRLMTEVGTKTKNKRKKVDMIASQYILQSYLDFYGKSQE